MAIRILIADDHPIIRTALRDLLLREAEFEVVGEAGDGHEALELALVTQPDIVMLDIAMPRLNGLEAARRISEALPAARTIVFSMHADEGYVLQALKAGVRGYVLKDSAEPEVVEAVRAVHRGNAFLSPGISSFLVQDYRFEHTRAGVSDNYDLLSNREREVLQLLAEGKSNKQAAAVLNVSVSTIDTHRGNIFHKLNIHSVAELVLYAVRKGVIA